MDETQNGGRKRKLNNMKEEYKAGDVEVLRFSKQFGKENFVVFNMPRALQDKLKNGDKVNFVGPENDQQTAVITTTEETFELTKVESSNMMLLVPPSTSTDSSYEITGTVSCIYEAKLSNPRLEQLKNVLGNNKYRGAEHEVPGSEKLTTELLCRTVQASKREIEEGLKKLEAVQILGYWRLLAPELEERTLDAILNHIMQHDLPMENISPTAVAAALSPLGHEPVVVRHCLRSHRQATSPAEGDGLGWEEEEYEDQVVLDMEKLAVFRAHQLFRAEEGADDGAAWELEDFRAALGARLPGAGAAPGAAALLAAGVALPATAPDGRPGLRYFPAARLPTDPARRFEALFKACEKWRPEEISAYLRAIVTPLRTEASLLLKYCRSLEDPVIGKVFIAR